MRKRYNKHLILNIIIIIILIIGIGHASLASNLSITGTTDVSGNHWDIHFSETYNEESTGEIITSATTDEEDNTKLTFSIALTKPGDYYEFSVDIINGGTIDGMIGNIEQKINNQPISSLPNYLEYNISYIDGTEIDNNQILPAGRSVGIVVNVTYKSDISNEDLPSTTAYYTFSLNVDYIQKNNSGINLQSKYFYLLGDLVQINDEIYDSISYSNNYEDLINPNVTSAAIIRAETVTDKIWGLSVGYITNNNVYYLINKPGDDIFYENKNTLFEIFGSSYCTVETDLITCEKGLIYGEAHKLGNVLIRINDATCSCDENGCSFAYQPH